MPNVTVVNLYSNQIVLPTGDYVDPIEPGQSVTFAVSDVDEFLAA